MNRWREMRRLDEHLFIKDLQVVFPKVLGAAEECRFGRTKARMFNFASGVVHAALKRPRGADGTVGRGRYGGERKGFRIPSC